LKKNSFGDIVSSTGVFLYFLLEKQNKSGNIAVKKVQYVSLQGWAFLSFSGSNIIKTYNHNQPKQKKEREREKL
jgi:hypothetical protein